MSLLSNELVEQQNLWVAQLGGSVAELQSVAEEARRHHNALLTAVSRMGELYAFCGRLVVQATTALHPTSTPHHVETAANARRVATQLKLSIQQWKVSDDTVALGEFLSAQQAQWKAWDSEVRRIFEHNKTRNEHCRIIAGLQQDVKRAQKNNPVQAEVLRRQIREEERARKYMDEKVQRNIEEKAKECGKDLVRGGTQCLDVLSRYGMRCATCFQPIDGREVQSSGGGGDRRSSASRSERAETVMGVVLERPSPSYYYIDGSTAAEEGSSHTRSNTTRQESRAAGSPTAVTSATSQHRDPSAV